MVQLKFAHFIGEYAPNILPKLLLEMQIVCRWFLHLFLKISPLKPSTVEEYIFVYPLMFGNTLFMYSFIASFYFCVLKISEESKPVNGVGMFIGI